MKKKPFGWSIHLDLYDCNDNIANKKKLQQYVDELCKLIDMKKFGKCLIPRFGLDSDVTAGYSLIQLIETSAILGHFSEKYKTAYFDIFSCKPYNTKLTVKFTKEFFGAKIRSKKILTRFL